MSDPFEPELPGLAGAEDEPLEPTSGPDDHTLIRRAQAGDEDAFRQLVVRHEDRAVRVAANMIGNVEDARDLAQEAFLRVFRNLDRFDFQHGFTTWLYRIVTNLGIDFLRRRRPAARLQGREEEDEFEVEDSEALSPSGDMERSETSERVRACIDRLAPHFRSVMVLRELEGLSCLEIADIVGATHVTVRWRLHRGRKLFQEEWERMERAASSGATDTTEATRANGPDASNARGSPS